MWHQRQDVSDEMVWKASVVHSLRRSTVGYKHDLLHQADFLYGECIGLIHRPKAHVWTPHGSPKWNNRTKMVIIVSGVCPCLPSLPFFTLPGPSEPAILSLPYVFICVQGATTLNGGYLTNMYHMMSWSPLGVLLGSLAAVSGFSHGVFLPPFFTPPPPPRLSLWI